MDENFLTIRKAALLQPPACPPAGGPGALTIALPEVFLHPGQNHVAPNPAILKMILGSCAGVFLFDSKLWIGGATHFMLPCSGEGPASSRYGDVALAELLESFRTFGCNHRNIEARIFGGACMVQAFEKLGSRIGQIGRRNIEIACKILERESIAIVEKDVFGNQARKVSMISNTGETALEFVRNARGN
jgi:chemotaxis protein CheD